MPLPYSLARAVAAIMLSLQAGLTTGEAHGQSDAAGAKVAHARAALQPALERDRGAPANEAGEGNRFLATAIQSLLRQPSVACNIRYRTNFFGFRLTGSGRYLQVRAGDDLLLRYELKIAVDDQFTNFLQVCDGRYLWGREIVLPRETSTADAKPEISRIDLRAVETSWEPIDKATAGRALEGMVVGGVPRLLASLLRSFDFDEPRSAQLQGVPIWVLQGTWKADRLEALSSDSDEKNSRSAGEWFAHLPHDVMIAIGQEDLFPYQIEYRHRPESESENDEVETPSRSLLAIELFEVQLGSRLDPSLFIFRPGDLPVRDDTRVFVASLRELSATDKPVPPRR